MQLNGPVLRDMHVFVAVARADPRLVRARRRGRGAEARRNGLGARRCCSRTSSQPEDHAPLEFPAQRARRRAPVILIRGTLSSPPDAALRFFLEMLARPVGGRIDDVEDSDVTRR